jgi:dinuclear metal center YbgI/SA1388 family protein
MEQLSPLKYAYEWDNVGLLIGDKSKEINRIMVALDATENVVDEAVDKKVDLLITHHPMIFKGLKKITTADFQGRKILKLIENKIALYAAHTNFDAVGSLSDALAMKLGLENIKLLETKEREALYKLVVFVPTTHVEQVRLALGNSSAGHLGNYSHCTFNTQGVGTFKPLEGATPFIGEENQLETVNEIRIETIVKEKDINQVINTMVEAHPYEEVAYDLYPLHQKGEAFGVGRIGEISTAISMQNFGQLVKEKLGLDSIRIYGNIDQIVQKIAICPGKGLSFIKEAIKQQADVMVTGDIDYHTAIDTLQEGLSLIDANHYGTEHIMVDYLINLLQEAFPHQPIEWLKANEYIPFVTL